MAGRSVCTTNSSRIAHRSTVDALLRVSHACETLLAGFNSGQAAALRSCVVSRERALAVSGRKGSLWSHGSPSDGRPSELPRDFLPPLEDAMIRRRARPSLLLPAWRVLGYAVGTSTTAILPPESLAKVQESLESAVAEQYDDHIRSLYSANIDEEESKVKELFKSQRDDPSRVKMEPDDADFNGSSMDTSALVVTGTLKSALRVACDMTSKV